MKKVRTKLRGQYNYLPLLKILSIMKNIFLLIILSGIQLVAAEETYGQKVRLSLEMNDVPVVSVLDEIENQSEFFFLYNSKLVDVQRKTSISVKKEKITKALSSIFTGTDVKYLVMGRQIILSPREELKRQNKSTDQLSQAVAELNVEKLISGQVTSDEGEPLIGVNIVLKGTATGTVSDLDGNYQLEVPDDATTLIFSYTGYEPQEVEIAARSVINVVLRISTALLDEVVVIGYGVQKKEHQRKIINIH